MICITELVIHSHYDLYNRAGDAVIKISITELVIHSHYDLHNRAGDAHAVIIIQSW